MANETEQLLAKLMTECDIEDLLARFDDAAIRYDHDAFRQLWMPDGIWGVGDPDPLHAQGQDAVVAAQVKGKNLLAKGNIDPPPDLVALFQGKGENGTK